MKNLILLFVIVLFSSVFAQKHDENRPAWANEIISFAKSAKSWVSFEDPIIKGYEIHWKFGDKNFLYGESYLEGFLTKVYSKKIIVILKKEQINDKYYYLFILKLMSK